jgi:arsenate reductase-like glutaredoxin family protein
VGGPAGPRRPPAERELNVQVFGFNDDAETRKALRFFAERRIPVHFVNLDERPAAKGELRRFQDKYGAAALIDREAPRFRALGLQVRGDSPERMLERALTEPRILRTPLVRIDQRVSLGYRPDDWKALIEAARPAPPSPARPRPGS